MDVEADTPVVPVGTKRRGPRKGSKYKKQKRLNNLTKRKKSVAQIDDVATPAVPRNLPNRIVNELRAKLRAHPEKVTASSFLEDNNLPKKKRFKYYDERKKVSRSTFFNFFNCCSILDFFQAHQLNRNQTTRWKLQIIQKK